MKKYLSLLLLSLCYAVAHAQVPQTHKIVYLKDGTNVKGTVTVNDSAGYVMIVDKYNETKYYQKSMVAKIDDEVLHIRSYDLKTSGYVCNIEIGGSDVLAKDNGTNLQGFSLNVVNSYLFSPFVSLGLGVGTELSSSGYNTEMFSLYADNRVYFMRSNISPFMDFAFGYNGMFMKYSQYNYYGGNNTVTKERDQGMIFNPYFGIRVAVGRKVAVTAGVGYKLYYLHTSNNNYYTESNDATFSPDGHGYYLFNAVTVKAGLLF